MTDLTATPANRESHNDAPVDTLFYDGQCSLCAREIEQLRSTRGSALKLVDIHDLETQSSDFGSGSGSGSGNDFDPGVSPQSGAPDKDQLLRVLHLRRSDGTWLKSADANVAAWAGTPHGRALKLLRWPIIRHFVDVVYRVWAGWRYRRLYGNQFQEDIHAPKQQ